MILGDDPKPRSGRARISWLSMYSPSPSELPLLSRLSSFSSPHNISSFEMGVCSCAGSLVLVLLRLLRPRRRLLGDISVRSLDMNKMTHRFRMSWFERSGNTDTLTCFQLLPYVLIAANSFSSSSGVHSVCFRSGLRTCCQRFAHSVIACQCTLN